MLISHAASYTDIHGSIVIAGDRIACPTVDAYAAAGRRRRRSLAHTVRDSMSGPRSRSTISEADTTPTTRPSVTTGTPDTSCSVRNTARSRSVMSGGTANGGVLIRS